MKRITIILSMLTSSMLLANSELDLKPFLEMNIIKESHLNIKQGKDIGNGWFYLEANSEGRKIGIFTDKQKVIVGRGFDNNSGEEIKFNLDMSKYKDNAAYKIGNGPNEYFLFTDPECPFCKMLDEKLTIKAAKEQLTIYTYFSPLSFHLASNAMTKAIMSQPKEKRSEYTSKIMKGPLSSIIPEIDKYSPDLYKDILKVIQSADPRMKDLPLRYMGEINKAYKLNLTNIDELKEYCIKQIPKIKEPSAINEKLALSEKLIAEDFEVNGTPTLYDMNGNKIENPKEIFLKNGIVNFDAIKEIEKTGFTVQSGTKGKEKLYIFTSTKCPNCIEQFKDKQMLSYLMNKYEIHYVLMATGNGKVALDELAYLYSINDMKSREKEFTEIMSGKTISADTLNKSNYSEEYKQKITNYGQTLESTFITGTPTIVNSKGKIVKSGEEL